ncbi:MAG: T9SS type A sorting domain-containing protein [Candidatus Kapaibacteriota bacterium]
MRNRILYTCLFLLCGISTFAQTVNLMFYVSARPGEHGMWVSRQLQNGSWIRGEKVLIDGVFDGNGVDPDIFKQQDGSLRLYYFQGYFVTPPPQNPGPNPIYSAVSTDGVRFTGKRKVFEYEGIFDPSVVKLPNGNYVMGCTQMVGMNVHTVVATSNDGLTFTYKTTVQNTGVPELMVLDDGSIRLFYNGPGGIISSRSMDGGTTWQKEQGVRLSSQQFVGDPSVSKVGNRLRMYVKGFNANGGQKLVGHKTQYAESTDGGNTFQMQQQLVLDSASVPEGVEMMASIKQESISGNDTLCMGENTKLEAVIKASPSFLTLTYEWSKNGVKLSNGGKINGANSTTLNITNCTQNDTGAYSLNVIAEGLSEGNIQQVFGPIRLAINQQTEITKDIDTAYMACHDETITITCNAIGKDIQYQWIQSDGKPINGENTNTIAIKNTSPSIENIRCIIVGACGRDTSKTASISFTSKAEIKKDLPSMVELFSGMDTVLQATINAKKYTYQWYQNDKAITQEIPGVNEMFTLNITSMDSSDQGIYHAVIRTECDTLSTQKTTVNMKVMSSVKEMSDVRVFPQPANTIIHIEHLESSRGQLTLFDMFGTQMRSLEIQEGKAILSTDDIPSGIYMLRMSTGIIPITIIH